VIWAVGIDKAYTDMSHQDDEPLGQDRTHNHDVCHWITVVRTGQSSQVEEAGRSKRFRKPQRGSFVDTDFTRHKRKNPLEEASGLFFL
jgi:hypothetical protein